MKKNSCEKTALKKGEMHVYDFGGVRLHAYRTNDAINDEVFFFEKEGKAVALESPCFFDNYKELTGYFARRAQIRHAECRGVRNFRRRKSACRRFHADLRPGF